MKNAALHVDSSMLRLVYWQDGVLTVMFTSGHIYDYVDVPRAIYQQLLAAPSMGQFFHAHVRTFYEFKQITKKGQPCPLIT